VDLSIIIINWNSAELLNTCLESIEKWVVGVSWEAIVVDNCSDNSDIRLCQEVLVLRYPWAKFIFNEENIGFAKANNQALKLCQGKKVLLLNPDTCFVGPGLSELLSITDQPKVGMVACKLLNADLSTQLSCFYYPLPVRVFATSLFLHKILSEKYRRKIVFVPGDLEHTQNPDWVLGAFMLVTREVLEHLGGFDESIFMYGEDMELCFRVRLLGLRIVYIPDFAVIHYGGCSGRKAWTNAKREILVYKAIFYFYRKHIGVPQLTFARVVFAIGALLRIAAYGLSCFRPGGLKCGLNEIKTQWTVFLTQLDVVKE
jgi:GT2 family glycosyltransferase